MRKCIYSAYSKEETKYLKDFLKSKWIIDVVYDTSVIPDILKNGKIDFILFDLETAGSFPTDILEKIRIQYPCINIFIITHSNPANLKKYFAQYKVADFFEFPKDKIQIFDRIENHLLNHNRHNANAKELKKIPIIGESNTIIKLKEFIINTANLKFPILISGETGVGKTMIAKIIHQVSNFKTGKFVPVNVSCIPETLAEAILFGSEKGSFTGAEKKEGLFSEANNGTLFLDEIENLSLNIQSKLLNVIETKQIRSIGATEFKKTDFRLICATNKDLKEMVLQKQFREDLYYRLDVLRYSIPPLRQRKEDIPLFINSYLEEKKQSITQEAIDKLVAHDWPGNIRELFNCLKRSQCNAINHDSIEAWHIEF